METDFVLFIFSLWLWARPVSVAGPEVVDCESVAIVLSIKGQAGSGHYYFSLVDIVVVTGDNIQSYQALATSNIKRLH